MSKNWYEIAQDYAVKVGFGKEIKGSGVLVKSEDNICYLFTAKHNFKQDGDNTHKDVKKENIISIIDTIYIEKVIFGETKIYMKKMLFFKDDLDLVVFLLEKNEISYIQELPLRVIFKDKLYKEYDYCFYGYPKGATDGFLSHGKYNLHNENDNMIFNLLDIDKHIDTDAVSGYSGSAVFLNIKDTEEVYLVGIVIRAEEGISHFEIVDLGRVIDKINTKLNVTIQLASSDENLVNLEKVDKAGKNVVDSEVNYNIDIEEIEIIKDDKKLGTITLKTVPVEVDGKVLNVSIYPVTFEEYDLFCEDINHKKVANDYNWGRGRRPIIDVSWYDARNYCKWLKGKSTENYRLLSSVEWNSIASQNISKKNYKKSIVFSKKKTAKVATKKVDLLGLYDFFGNIYEWCENEYCRQIKLKGIAYNDSLPNFDKIFNNEMLIPLDTHDYRIGFRIVYSED